MRPLPACFLAEVLGTFLLIFFGCGAVHVAVLTGDLSGLWQVGIVWGLSIMLAIYVVGAISGAHINPAITVGLAGWGLFPKHRVLPYIAAQLIGAFAAAALLFAIYMHFLDAKELEYSVVRGGPGSQITAMCYGEYFPNPGAFAASGGPPDAAAWEVFAQRVPQGIACLAEVVGTLILALVVAAVTDEKNPFGPQRYAPVFIGLTVAGLICVIAPLTQACFNPARDWGPRMFAYLAGWREIAIPGPNGIGCVTVYILSPLVGGLLGVGLYQRFLRPVILESSE